jgi:hypothetical protein
VAISAFRVSRLWIVAASSLAASIVHGIDEHPGKLSAMFTPSHPAIVDRQLHPDGLCIEIHEATVNSRTLWHVVAFLRNGNVNAVGSYDSVNEARGARDSYNGPR